MKREQSAGAIIFSVNENERVYLLLHYKYKTEYWDFVKGNREKGETAEETTQRETQEETGITNLVFIPGFEEKVTWVYRRDGELISKEVMYFLCRTTTTVIHLSEEHIGYGWFTFEEAMEKIAHKNSKELLIKAESFLNKLDDTSLKRFL